MGLTEELAEEVVSRQMRTMHPSEMGRKCVGEYKAGKIKENLGCLTFQPSSFKVHRQTPACSSDR